jgi:TatD DNase family protein
MLITDDHAHIESEWITKEFGSVEKFVEIQKENSVKFIISQSIDKKTAIEALDLSSKYDIILPSLGIYPHSHISDLKDYDLDFSWIKGNINKAVAIGEVGLDYSYEKYNALAQRDLFKKFMSLAIAKKKPIIVHSRKAEKDVVELMVENKVKKGVLHCFSGNKKLIKYAYKNGLYFSVPTNIVKSEHFQMLVSMVNISRILTETDSPFLSPFSDGKPNQPKNILESLKVIAKIKEMTLEETANTIFQNFQKLYL